MIVNKPQVSALFLLSAIFGFMLFLNLHAPLMADDFCYAASSFSEVWSNAVDAYVTFNGRFVVHVLVPMLTLFPEWVFDIANTLVFISLLLLMTVIALGSRIRVEDLVWAPPVAFFLLWFGVPDFGQSMLWQLGSANYLWNITLVLAFLVPYRFLVDGRDILSRRGVPKLLFPMLSVASGCTSENTAATAWLLAGLALCIYHRRQSHTPMWAVFSMIGFTIGFAAMVLSPGHHARLALPVFQAWQELPWMTKFIRFAPNALASFSNSWVIWIVIGGAAFITLRRGSALDDRWRREIVVAGALACAAVLNNLVLVLAPMAPLRALTGGAVYLSMSALTVVPWASQLLRARTRLFGVAAILSALIVSMTGVAADYRLLKSRVLNREEAIATATAAGMTTLTLTPILMRPSRHMYWGSITDLTYNTSHWANRCFCDYAGFEEARLITPFEDKFLISIGPSEPIELSERVKLMGIHFSRSHGCLIVILDSASNADLYGQYLDLRVLSDQSPWYRKSIDAVRRRLLPETDVDAFEYPFSTLRKLLVFASFRIHDVFLEESTVTDWDGRPVVFVRLKDPATGLLTLYIGVRAWHDAPMRLQRIR